METYTLLAQGAYVNYHAANYGKWTPLHAATKNNDWVRGFTTFGYVFFFVLFFFTEIFSQATMALLLNNGGDVEAVDAYETTSMHIAAQDQLIEAITVLVKNGASENAKDFNGKKKTLT